MSDSEISSDFLEDIVCIEKTIKRFNQILEQYRNYKVGDIFLFQMSYRGEYQIEENPSLKLPQKWKLVYKSEMGIPVFKKLTPSGKTSGPLSLPLEFNHFDFSLFEIAEREEFIPDPEQLDALLLQEDFNPTEKLAQRSLLLKEITAHNKSVLIKTTSKGILDFFDKSPPGTSFWTSIDKQYVIDKIEKEHNRYFVICLNVYENKKERFPVSYFWKRRLYRDKPRSFAKETKDELG